MQLTQAGIGTQPIKMGRTGFFAKENLKVEKLRIKPPYLLQYRQCTQFTQYQWKECIWTQNQEVE